MDWNLIKPSLTEDYTMLNWEERRTLREKYIKAQEELCYHCKGSLREEPIEKRELTVKMLELFPKGFWDNPIHLHHDHSTGMTIGAVHANCNAILWVFHGE